jgi:hypothetical protein
LGNWRDSLDIGTFFATNPICALEFVGIITHGTKSGLFLKKIQINLMEAWDDEGKVIIHRLH